MRAGTSLVTLGRYNTNVVIHTLRQLKTSSQTQIAQASHLSVQTVSAIVRHLVASGVVREAGTQAVARGRPRVLLELVPDAAFAVGLHIDPSLMTAVVLDLSGTVVQSRSSDEVDPDDPAPTLDRAAELVTDVVGAAGVEDDRLAGVRVALPGPMDGDSESILDTVWLPGWSGVPVGRDLARRLGVAEVPLVKDTLAAVTGERWVRSGGSVDSTMVFVYIGTGTGLGLSVQGEPVRGFSGNAGEVGRLLVALDGGSDRPGVGLSNDPVVLVSRAHEMGLLDGPTPTHHDLRVVEAQCRQVCARAAEGEHGASALLESTAGRIGALALVATEMIDADTVVFGGPYWGLLEPWYMPAARRALDAPSARGPQSVRLLSTAMGDCVGAVGAAAVVLDDLFVPRTRLA